MPGKGNMDTSEPQAVLDPNSLPSPAGGVPHAAGPDAGTGPERLMVRLDQRAEVYRTNLLFVTADLLADARDAIGSLLRQRDDESRRVARLEALLSGVATVLEPFAHQAEIVDAAHPSIADTHPFRFMGSLAAFDVGDCRRAVIALTELRSELPTLTKGL